MNDSIKLEPKRFEELKHLNFVDSQETVLREEKRKQLPLIKNTIKLPVKELREKSEHVQSKESSLVLNSD